MSWNLSLRYKHGAAPAGQRGRKEKPSYRTPAWAPSVPARERACEAESDTPGKVALARAAREQTFALFHQPGCNLLDTLSTLQVMWLRLFSDPRLYERYAYFFWIEPDVLPLRPAWLDALQNDVRRVGQGPGLRTRPQGRKLVTGVILWA